MVFANRFRHDLARALPLWLSDELVSGAQAEKLRDYYRLDELESAGRSGFVTALLTFGALLVGLGVLSFVAANWGAIAPEVRALGGLVLLIGLNGLGFAWWNRPERRRRGGAVLALAGFVLGGVLVLMAQWFQVSGSTAGLFAAWGLGCLAMGAGLAHAFLIAMAGVLLLAALGTGAELGWLYPWLFAGVFLPLASWCRSRAVWIVGAIGLSGSMAVVLAPLDPPLWVIGQLMVLLGLWSAAEIAQTREPWKALRMRLNAREAVHDAPAMEAVGRPLVLVGLLSLLHLLSFQAAWGLVDGSPFGDVAMAPVAALSALGIAAVAIAAYGRARRRLTEPVLHRAIGGVVVLLSVLLLAPGLPPVQGLLVNGLLLGLQLLLAWQGLSRGERLWFWLGFGSLSVQVFARFLEFETGLLMKSLAFVLWGVALIAVGVRFERTVRPPLPQGGA